MSDISNNGGGDVDLTTLVTTINNGVRAINNLAVVLQQVFPQVASLANSAGGASGEYAVVTFGGTTYKIQLLSV
jgi:hypothetical protein